MNFRRFFAYAFIISINILILSFLFSCVFVLLPKYEQDVFRDSFHRQKKSIKAIIRRVFLRGRIFFGYKTDEELPIFQHSSFIFNIYLTAKRILQSIFGVFLSIFYAFKALFKVVIRSFNSTFRYAESRIQSINIILTGYTVKVIKLCSKITRFFTFGFRWIKKITEDLLFKMIPEDTNDKPFQ
ncbi:hypothetical protein TRFO_32263 [Tritrichomonas foetus]|uniref:Uncharacterized protein n=1 Tax=Tritrichomonas foetus TaxID=1144522 RepID=A0A1J4JTT0_9EUKA|nr:hypothetical protein TRFO_32263 [Tritrichomonas foetus]|eukprot:OHT00918.1 hypothetical protein TRFO_32263 [Tritrichomonas foetus]